MSMSDSTIRTDKEHRVFPGKLQPLVSVHFTVILKAEADVLGFKPQPFLASVFRKHSILE